MKKIHLQLPELTRNYKKPTAERHFFRNMALLTLLALVLLCAILVSWTFKRKRHSLPYPPGPPGDLVIGHFRTLYSDDAHETLYKWSKQYGDVMYLNILGKPVVVLSSEEAASQLLDKRSLNYSDRPRFPMFERYSTITFINVYAKKS